MSFGLITFKALTVCNVTVPPRTASIGMTITSLSSIKQVLEETVGGYVHLYFYGTTKCKVISDLINRPIIDLEDFKCPKPRDIQSRYNCVLSFIKIPSTSCATRNVHSLYDCLMFHLKAKSYVVSKRYNAPYHHVCFSGIKQHKSTYRSFYLAMSARKSPFPQTEGGETEPKCTAPELDTWNFFVEIISLSFDPASVLLRRVFFVNNEISKFVFNGF